MQIHQSAEDYLETILMLTQRMGRVRSIDVVNELGYTKASSSDLQHHFFVQLGVDEDVAAEDACKAEHILSEQTLKKIREYALLHDAEDSVQKSE